MNRFANRYVNATLPSWFYLVLKLVTPFKGAPSNRDVHPIGIGECLRRAIHHSLIADRKDVLAQHFLPQQVAIGVPSGISLLIFGVRALLDLHPDWVVIKIDIRNAYNEIKRSRVLQRLLHADILRDYAPMFWATHSPTSDVALASAGLPVADFCSSEGVQQGDSFASVGFCAGIHPEICCLDAEVGAHGGCAKFDMDDGYVVGPPSVAFAAVQRFSEAISALGLYIRTDKCFCFSPAGGLEECDHRPSAFPLGRASFGDIEGYGIIVSGIPVGDEAYVQAKLGAKADEAVSKIETVTTKLRDVHLQSLFTALYYGLSPLFDFWLQHCYPEDTSEHAQQIDVALLITLRACIPGIRPGSSVTMQRVRLPARRFGLGIRSRFDLIPAAFVNSVCHTVPRMLPWQGRNGCVHAGFLPQLENMLGAGSFDWSNEDTRFQHLLQSDSRLGSALESAWEGLRAANGDEPDGVLRHDASGAGQDSERLQRDITWQRETLRFKALDSEIRALAPTDMRLHAWANLDSFSTVWVTCWPQPECYLTNSEFLEVTARYLGLPSPMCEVLAGAPIVGSRQTLDRYGCNLASLPLPGDGWRQQHDNIKWRVIEDAKDAGVPVRPEVYGLFAACIPQHSRRLFDKLPVRKRQGLVPDLELTLQWDGAGPERPLLFEFKTLHHAASTYPHADGRCKAVNRRARALPAEYCRKARAVDRNY